MVAWLVCTLSKGMYASAAGGCSWSSTPARQPNASWFHGSWFCAAAGGAGLHLRLQLLHPWGPFLSMCIAAGGGRWAQAQVWKDEGNKYAPGQ